MGHLSDEHAWLAIAPRTALTAREMLLLLLDVVPGAWPWSVRARAPVFLACVVGCRRTLGIPRGGARLAAAAVALAKIPLGTELAATSQLAALDALVVSALSLEAKTVLIDDARPLD